jgi:hypothetical protein
MEFAAASLISSAISGIVAAYVTMRLALHRFHQEKWWEAKMRSYASIIDSLHHMKRESERFIKAEKRGLNTDSDSFQASDTKLREAWAKMRRAIDVGDFLLSQPATAVLQKFDNDAAKAKMPDGTYLEHLEDQLKAVEACLPAIKEAGREDLKLLQ